MPDDLTRSNLIEDPCNCNRRWAFRTSLRTTYLPGVNLRKRAQSNDVQRVMRPTRRLSLISLQRGNRRVERGPDLKILSRCLWFFELIGRGSPSQTEQIAPNSSLEKPNARSPTLRTKKAKVSLFQRSWVFWGDPWHQYWKPINGRVWNFLFATMFREATFHPRRAALRWPRFGAIRDGRVTRHLLLMNIFEPSATSWKPTVYGERGIGIWRFQTMEL